MAVDSDGFPTVYEGVWRLVANGAAPARDPIDSTARAEMIEALLRESFRWIGEISSDGGETWRVEQEMLLRRRQS